MTTKRAPAPVGTKFGELTVIGDAVPGKLGNYVPCMCDCGTPAFVLWSKLNAGDRTRCGTGCHPRIKAERLYGIWGNMKDRCFNVNNPAYPRYGGRGIRVCPPWQRYQPFREWALSHGYTDDLTLERRDNDAGYFPRNCKWIPREEQARNRRSCITIELDGERKILAEWAEDTRCVVKYSTLYARIKSGWTFKDAMTLSVGSKKPQASDG